MKTRNRTPMMVRNRIMMARDHTLMMVRNRIIMLAYEQVPQAKPIHSFLFRSTCHTLPRGKVLHKAPFRKQPSRTWKKISHKSRVRTEASHEKPLLEKLFRGKMLHQRALPAKREQALARAVAKAARHRSRLHTPCRLTGRKPQYRQRSSFRTEQMPD